MSGGSFNYLCFSDFVADAAAKMGDLEEMAKALPEDHPVGKWTRDLLAKLREPIPEDVRNVWHAREWWGSNDIGHDDYEAVLEETRTFESRDCRVCVEKQIAAGRLNIFGVGMIVCGTCGNKRCPKATDHTLDCTGSNEPGQAGSIYE